MAETKHLWGEKTQLVLIHLWGDMNLRNFRDNKDADLLMNHDVQTLNRRGSDGS